jgi:hypothetical protein
MRQAGAGHIDTRLLLIGFLLFPVARDREPEEGMIDQIPCKAATADGALLHIAVLDRRVSTAGPMLFNFGNVSHSDLFHTKIRF